jgi:hypothetical protein
MSTLHEIISSTPVHFTEVYRPHCVFSTLVQRIHAIYYHALVHHTSNSFAPQIEAI